MTFSCINQLFRQKSFLFLVLLFYVFLSACGGNSESPESIGQPKTGKLVFKAIWQEKDLQTTLIDESVVSTESVSAICGEGVTTVEAIVYFEGGRRNGGPWPCSEGKGTISNVEAGDNRTIVIIGKNETSSIYRGSISGVTVMAGKTTDAGEIECLPFSPDELEPENNSNVVQGEYQLRWRSVEDAKRYQIQLSTESNFQTKLVDTSVQQTNYSPPSDLIGRGTYYWRIRAEDGQGNLGAWTTVLSFTVTYNNFLINSDSGDGGSIFPSGETNVQAGEDFFYSIVPQTGYFIKEVLVDGQPMHDRPNEYTFRSINKTHSIRATFIPGLYVDGKNTVANPDGLSWETAYPSIQEAIDASHPSEASEVRVMKGEYALSKTINVDRPISIYGGFDGVEATFGDRDWVTNRTTIDGQGSVRCLYITGEATIDGFQINNGNADDSGEESGGGVYIRTESDKKATIINCTFFSNAAEYFGGGVCIDSSSPNVINCFFMGNRAFEGGGMYCKSNLYLETIYPSIKNSTFTLNFAEFGGGAIWIEPGEISTGDVVPILINCILWDNNSSNGYEEIGGDVEDLSVSYSVVEMHDRDASVKFPGNGNINMNPSIDFDYYYETLHMMMPKLLTSSPCIDAGLNEDLSPFDMEGDPRIIDGDGDGTLTVDIGADEYLPQK